ncbi:MAG: calcium/sodium antiporter [Oligoflexus sp.]
MAVFFLMIVGLGLLVLGADLLVRGSSRLALALGMSPLLIGLTLVSFGTSSPEFAITIFSAYKGQTDLAFGNVVGSNIFNILFILGAAALIYPLRVAAQLVRIDVPIMIGVSILLVVFAADGHLSLLDTTIFLVLMVAYLYLSIRIAEKTNHLETHKHQTGSSKFKLYLQNIGIIVIGLVLLVLGSRYLVDSAIELARRFAVSEMIIGLTIVAAGTSIPEVATSLLASIRKEADIAVGNVVGSCIFNVLAVLGLAGLLSGEGIPVESPSLLLNLTFLIASALVCLPIFFTGFRVSRSEGLLFLIYYGMYLTILIQQALQPEAVMPFAPMLLLLILPFAGLIFINYIRDYFRKKNAP